MNDEPTSGRPVTDLRVTRLGLSPMKGTRHLPHQSVTLDARGPVGDRLHCLVDPQTRRVLRTVQHPQLVRIVAEPAPAGLRVTAPSRACATVASEAEHPDAGPQHLDGSDSSHMTVDYWGREVSVETLPGEASALFSAYLGREVLLARAPRGEVVYGGQVTLLHEASLRALQSASGLPAADHLWHRFRPTAVIGSAPGAGNRRAPAFAEETWQGRVVDMGAARLLLGAPVPRCAVIDINPMTGRRDGDLLRTLATQRPLNERGEPSFGVFATVLSPGTVGLGDQFAF